MAIATCYGERFYYDEDNFETAEDELRFVEEHCRQVQSPRCGDCPYRSKRQRRTHHNSQLA